MPESTEELDLAKVQEFIKGQVETYTKEVLERQKAETPPVTQSQPVNPEEQARENLRSVINPFIQPGLNALQTEVLDVKDSSQFYANFDGTDEEKQAIEQMFANLKAQNRPIPRKDIKHYLDGKLADENPQEYEKRTSERRKRQTARLNGAGDFGAGSLDKGKADISTSDLWKMPMEELEKVMAGVTF